MRAVPERFRSIFWNVDFDTLDVERHPVSILARVLEHGQLDAVRWALDEFGDEAVLKFFRDGGHPELSPRTVAFWKAYFRAEEEEWDNRPAWRRAFSGHWIW